MNGKTIELAEAEAVLAVCKWRKDVLLKEQSESLSSTSPPPRFAAALTRTGQRLLYSGGWYVHGAVPKGDLMVLNLEHELEKRRRQNDEYVARMERQRYYSSIKSLVFTKYIIVC